LDASGKTRLAAELATLTGLAHIEDDRHRYVSKSDWVKKSKIEFISSVHKAVAEHAAQGRECVLDCAYNDAYDPEHAMIALMRDAVASAPIDKKPVLVVLTMGTLAEAVETLLGRVVGRATGAYASPVIDESPANSANLLIKFVQTYHWNVAALEELSVFAREQGCTVYTGRYEDMRAIVMGVATGGPHPFQF
jgi:hypothetical protein